MRSMLRHRRRLLTASSCVAFAVIFFVRCAHEPLRGRESPSPDHNTYLVVDTTDGPSCGAVRVDGREWQYALHQPGPVEPGLHRIQCGQGGSIEFNVSSGTTFHFNYWGP